MNANIKVSNLVHRGVSPEEPNSSKPVSAMQGDLLPV